MTTRTDAIRVGAEPMPAGRELDALVAERVMGWRGMHWTTGRDGSPVPLGFDPAWRATHSVDLFSTDIAAAWEVVDRMRDEHGYACGIDIEGSSDLLFVGVTFMQGARIIDADADSVPLAICRAALAAPSPE